MKIAFIGAGSYVFGPSVLAQLYAEQPMNDVHLALVDPDIETIELLASVGRRIADEHGLKTSITAHVEREEALVDADFVICTASPQMQRRFAMDTDIIREFIPGHVKSEFGGIAGISYSLRQIALIEAITDDMRQLCPGAWLLDVANPLPRVVQAAHENGIKSAGFCVVSISAYAMLWDIIYGEWLEYPFGEARDFWQIKSAGLNHLAWLLEFRDRVTGDDLLPVLREKLSGGNRSDENPRSQQFVRETGYLLVPGDEHTKDFLDPIAAPAESDNVVWHGNSSQRQERHEMLRLIGAGERPWRELLANGAWEKPVQFIAALTGGASATFHSLNLINGDSHITNLPKQVIVETPCRVELNKVLPETVTLPDSVLPVTLRTALVTDTIVRAARSRSRSLVHEAVQLDPTVLDKPAGVRAIDACLLAHADLLPTYS